MNKYEKIYLKAVQRSKNSEASWLDSAVAALAVDLEDYTGEVFEIGGPYGLRAEVTIISSSYSLTVTPSFKSGCLEIYYDTGKRTQVHQPNTVGSVNGFNNLQARLPDTIEEIVSIMTPLCKEKLRKETGGYLLPRYAIYKQQQSALDEIAAELGVICYRPHYHGLHDDKNTVFLYTAEDAAHNLLLEKQRDESFDSMVSGAGNGENPRIVPRDIFPNYFWSFENSDIRGEFTYDFANCGKVDLHGSNWREGLKGAIQVALIGKRQREHIIQTGGWGALREADEVYNDLNREKIAAFKMWHKDMRLGIITLSGEERLKVIAGNGSVYKEYNGQTIYNFSYSFCVPEADQKLEEMIRAWNRDEQLPKSGKSIEKITKRIEVLGGFYMVWF